MYFWYQVGSILVAKTPKSRLGIVLGRLGASWRRPVHFLGRLGSILGVLGIPWQSPVLPGAPWRSPTPTWDASGGTTGGLRPRQRHDTKSKRMAKGGERGNESEGGKFPLTRRTGRRISGQCLFPISTPET